MPTDDEVMFRVRVPGPLMREAHRVAAMRDETVSQAVRRALRDYVAKAPRQGDIEDAIAADRRRSKKREG